MAKFIYVGDRDELTSYRVTFQRGEITEVTDPTLLKKLPGHSDFRAADGVTDVEVKTKHSEGLTKAQLQAALDEKGITYESGANKVALVALLDGAADLA